MTIDPALLVLIEGERAVLKMIATWPAVGRGGEDLEDVKTQIWRTEEIRRGGATVSWVPDALVARWARASGVDELVVEHWLPILVDNGMIGPDGVVDEDVRTLVRAAGVRALKGGRA